MTPAESKEHSAQALNLALTIADDTCRADVESYARLEELGDPNLPPRYNLNEAIVYPGDTQEDADRNAARAQRAARYIRLRGDAFPWVMRTDPVYDGIVWFEDKPEPQA